MKSNHKEAPIRVARLVAGVLFGLLSLVVFPLSALAAPLHTPTAFSPITGAGIGAPFAAPLNLAADESNGNIFVLSGKTDNSVDILSSEGGTPVGLASPFTLGGFNFGVERLTPAFDNAATSPSKGTLYVPDESSEKVKKYVRNPGTEHYEAAGELTSTPPLGKVRGVTTDKDGNIYVASVAGGGFQFGSIIKFSPTGTQLARLEATQPAQQPRGLAVDDAGDIFVISATDKVFKYPVNGLGEPESSNVVAVLPSSDQAGGIAIDRTSNTFFVLRDQDIIE
jgi:hypothetical protein